MKSLLLRVEALFLGIESLVRRLFCSVRMNLRAPCALLLAALLGCAAVPASAQQGPSALPTLARSLTDPGEHLPVRLGTRTGPDVSVHADAGPRFTLRGTAVGAAIGTGLGLALMAVLCERQCWSHPDTPKLLGVTGGLGTLIGLGHDVHRYDVQLEEHGRRREEAARAGSSSIAQERHP